MRSRAYSAEASPAPLRGIFAPRYEQTLAAQVLSAQQAREAAAMEVRLVEASPASANGAHSPSSAYDAQPPIAGASPPESADEGAENSRLGAACSECGEPVGPPAAPGGVPKVVCSPRCSQARHNRLRKAKRAGRKSPPTTSSRF